jgi:hypothetical protein
MPNPNIVAYNNFSATVYVVPSSSDISPAFRMRASSAGLNAKQDIESPDLIDGAIDNTTYKLGGMMVEGDIAFPMLHEGTALGLTGQKAACSTFTQSLAQGIWKMAAGRDNTGRLLYNADITIVYPDNSQYLYSACHLNSLGLKVAQMGNVEMSSSWVGLTKTAGVLAPTTFAPSYLSPARQVTWNDFSILCYSADGGTRIGQDVDGEGIRDFDLKLNNNIERAFTFNGSLYPQDVYAKKRKIEGTLKLLGRSYYLNNMGATNQNYFTSNEHMAFGYRIGTGNIYWATVLHGVIYKTEDMQLNPSDLFESTIPFIANGDCGYSFEGLEVGINLGQATLPHATQGGDTYGGPSRSTTPAYNPFQGWVIINS